MPRNASAIAVLAVAALAAVLLLRSGGEDRVIHATFEGAIQLVDGARVTAAGVPVGTVDDVRLRDGHADVTLAIDDDEVWPLREGTKAEIRWGGTVSYSNRYVELTPGPERARPLPDGARLATADTVTPVEVDEVIDIFDEATRRGLAGVVDGGARAFGPRAAELREGLEVAGPTFSEAAEVFDALGGDRHALRTLVSAGAGTASALAANAPALRSLVDDAGATLAEIAAHAEETGRTIADLPGTLRAARGTLERADPVVSHAGTVVDDLRPAGGELRRLARPLGSALTTLRDVAPELDRTLVALDRAAPPTTAFLDDAHPLVERLVGVLRDATPMIACVRPYAPEIAGFLTSWSAISSTYDATGHYARVLLQAFPFTNTMPISADAATKLFPDVGYARIRPPGYGAFAQDGGTWLQPECGAGERGLDPATEVAP